MKAVPRYLLLTTFTLCLMLAACSSTPSTESAEWVQSIEEWQTKRQDRLRKPDSWLTLVGLYWLDQGANSFGSDPENDLVFPEPAPARLGVILVDQERLLLEVVPGTGMTVDGQPARNADLLTDRDESTTRMAWGSMLWYLIERGQQIGLRLKDSLAAERVNFAGLEYFDLDPEWRVKADFVAYDPPRTIPVPTILGTVSNSPSPGEIVFEKGGAEHRLQVVGDPEDDQYFIIFADETNGSQTYGGGRFLYADAPGHSKKMIVDFNKAYSPPCVFSPYATCPLPPPGNALKVSVEVGEKMYVANTVH